MSSNSYYEFIQEELYKFPLRPEGMSEASYNAYSKFKWPLLYEGIIKQYLKIPMTGTSSLKIFDDCYDKVETYLLHDLLSWFPRILLRLDGIFDIMKKIWQLLALKKPMNVE
jgi:hypothetical protein